MKFTHILALLLCACLLTGCQSGTTSSLDVSQERWSQADQPPQDTPPEVAVPDVFQGLTYEEALAQKGDTGYELVWSGRTVLSPSGGKVAYGSNKTDLAQGTYALFLLDTKTQTEQVLFQTQSYSLCPLWWPDDNHLVYQQDEAYYLWNLSGSQNPTLLKLEGTKPYLSAFDGDVFVYAPSFDDQTSRVVAKLGEDDVPETLAEYTVDQDHTLMVECAISEKLHLVAFKERDQDNSRRIVLLDYETKQTAILTPPDQMQTQESPSALIDLYFSGTDLAAVFRTQAGSEQTWSYSFSD